jgi:hypothetical protein
VDLYVIFFLYFRSRSFIEDVEGIVYISEVNPSDPNLCEEMTLRHIQSFLSFLQNMLKEWPTKLPKLVLVTRGIYLIGDQSPTCPATSPILGIFRTFLSENRGASAKLIDLSPDEADSMLDAMQVVFEMWADDEEHLISYRGGSRHILKLTNSSRLGLPYTPLELNTSTSARRYKKK